MSEWEVMKTHNITKKTKVIIRHSRHNYEITHFLALCLEGAATAGSSVVCEDVGLGGDSISTL